MPIQTYLSTGWMEVGGIGFSTMVKVVLTNESEAYLISVTNVNGRPEACLFKLDAKYLCENREDFFNAVMDAWGEAEKMLIERAFEMRILTKDELHEILQNL